MYALDNRVYVSVTVSMSAEGVMRPINLRWENGFYVADGETVIESRVTVTGDVFLILKDGCTLTINGGIAVNEGNSLTVFSQSEGENTGILIADSGNNRNCSGIGNGRGRSCGTVNIHGGHITATGGYEGAGIGSAKDTVGGAVNIYGGIITANSVRDGGGIGSGKGGSVNIYGGIVNAGCEDDGSGIDGDFTLYGGNVKDGFVRHSPHSVVSKCALVNKNRLTIKISLFFLFSW